MGRSRASTALRGDAASSQRARWVGHPYLRVIWVISEMNAFADNSTFDDFADSLQVERGPRSLFIIGGSKIDHLLLEILRAYLLPKSAKAKDPDELLEGDTPLSTFSSRIKMCHRLGIIDGTLFSALEKLRAIRNLSAHGLAFNHASSPLRDHISDFRKHVEPRKSFALTKARYFDGVLGSETEEWQCLLLTLCVLLESVKEKTQRTKEDPRTIKISSR